MPEHIDSMTIKHFSQLLDNNKKTIINDVSVLFEVAKLRQVLEKIEDISIEKKSKAAAKKISSMTEEERMMVLMCPEEKTFYIAYKQQHPENPWGYYKEYQKNIQDGYESNGKLPQL